MTKKRYKNRRESFYAALELSCSDRIVFDLKIFSNIPDSVEVSYTWPFSPTFALFSQSFLFFFGRKSTERCKDRWPYCKLQIELLRGTRLTVVWLKETLYSLYLSFSPHQLASKIRRGNEMLRGMCWGRKLTDGVQTRHSASSFLGYLYQ